MGTLYKEKAQAIKDAKKHMDKLCGDVWDNYQKENPEAKNIGFKPNNIVYIRQPKGYSNVYPSIVDHITSLKGPKKTQKSILELVQANYPNFKISASIWTREIPAWQHKKLQTRIHSNFRPAVSIKGCKTLSAIKKKIEATKYANVAEQNLKLSLSVTKEALVVGKKAYPITIRGNKEYQYPSIRVTVGKRRQWINLEALLTLIKK